MSTGILLTNNLNESEFKTINKKLNSSNITNSTKTDASINSLLHENTTDEIPKNLRKYQSDDSICTRYLTKLIEKKSSIDVTVHNKDKTSQSIDDKNSVVIDPLGAYLLTSSSTLPPPAIIDPLSSFMNENETNAQDKRKLDELFGYEPFKAEREEEKKSEIIIEAAHNHEYCENDSLNDDNFDDDESYDDNDDDENDNYSEEEEDDDEDEDEDEQEEEEEEDDNSNNVTSSNNMKNTITSATTLPNKNKNALFNSLLKQVTTKVTNVIELNSKLKDVTKFTTEKFIDLKSQIQTSMPYTLSQQEIASKLKSISAYTINKNLIAPFSGNNSQNSLNNSLNHSYSFQNKVQKDTKSVGSVSQASNNDDIEMPEAAFEIDDVFEIESCNLKDVLISVEISSCNKCKFCNCLLYDEEIMSVWSSNDSEMNIQCIYCKKPQVPNLFIKTRVRIWFCLNRQRSY